MTNEEAKKKAEEALNKLLIELEPCKTDECDELRDSIQDILRELDSTMDEDYYDSYDDSHYDSGC